MYDKKRIFVTQGYIYIYINISGEIAIFHPNLDFPLNKRFPLQSLTTMFRGDQPAGIRLPGQDDMFCCSDGNPYAACLPHDHQDAHMIFFLLEGDPKKSQG